MQIFFVLFAKGFVMSVSAVKLQCRQIIIIFIGTNSTEQLYLKIQ